MGGRAISHLCRRLGENFGAKDDIPEIRGVLVSCSLRKWVGRSVTFYDCTLIDAALLLLCV